MKESFYEIAVNYPVYGQTLTYSSTEESFEIGDLVFVPLGKRMERGCVVNFKTEHAQTDFKIKKIKEKIVEDIKLSKKELELYKWMSQYYHYPLGQLIFDCLPKFLKRPRKFEHMLGEGKFLPYELNKDQNDIYLRIKAEIDKGFSKHLIHGVTGSGKSSIYLKLIQDIIAQNKTVLFLLPEINLTPQFTDFFKEHLNCNIYTYHSGISQSDKFSLWKMLQDDQSGKLILGVRSSVFLPIKNLGLIVVDEEHDVSFKQDDRCPYNARDVAIKKASLFNIPVILGSATPMLENYYQFKKTNSYYELRQRAALSDLPIVSLINLKEDVEKSEHWPLSQASLDELQNALERNEQAIVFINRLGFSHYVQCKGCGHQFQCSNCSVTLTPYKQRNTLECHHCEFKVPIPKSCPVCSCLNLTHRGFGTEKVDEVLSKYFSDKKIERFDRDEIKNINILKDKLERFHKHEIDIFVGTQMLSKGHNFKRVNTIIILGVDSQLNYPDFRSEERVYQLLTQVTGRAGRFGKKSRVLIQTFNSELQLFKEIKEHSFTHFYDNEIEIRKMANCPPFTKIAMVHMTSKNKSVLEKFIKEETLKLKEAMNAHFPKVSLWGPRPSFIERRANQYTWNFMLKTDEVTQLHNVLSTLQQNIKLPHQVNLKIDVDPYFTN